MPLKNGNSIPRPAIKAVYSQGNDEFETISLIDSGADMSAMDSRIAKKLNLDLTGPDTESYSVNGTIRTIISSTTVTVQNGEGKHVIPIPVRVLFMDKESPVGTTILGRKGFFDKFVITIDENNQQLMLEPNETIVN